MKTHSLFRPTMLAAAIALAVAFSPSCAGNAPPNLGPHATQSWYKTRVIKSLDVVRDIAIDANAQTPPLIPTATTRKVVNFHESALKIIGSTDAGWRGAVSTGLDELMNSLTPAEKSQLGPYIALVKTVLQEVGTEAANLPPGYRFTLALEEVRS